MEPDLKALATTDGQGAGQPEQPGLDLIAQELELEGASARSCLGIADELGRDLAEEVERSCGGVQDGPTGLFRERLALELSRASVTERQQRFGAVLAEGVLPAVARRGHRPRVPPR